MVRPDAPYIDRRHGVIIMSQENKLSGPAPGVCIPWEEKRKEMAQITGDEEIVKQVWEDLDGFGYLYIWQCLLSF